jgi:uncharacterized membrane protein YkgB
MAIAARNLQNNAVEPATGLETAGHLILRYGLLLVVGWIGAMKFTAYEAAGIQPLVANSPLMGWMYHFLSVRLFSSPLGTVEIAIAVMIALRSWSAEVAALGSAMAVAMFLTTLSFLFSTPGWEPSVGGFPGLSAMPGQFLLKDVVLLGAAVWSLGEALSVART